MAKQYRVTRGTVHRGDQRIRSGERYSPVDKADEERLLALGVIESADAPDEQQDPGEDAAPTAADEPKAGKGKKAKP